MTDKRITIYDVAKALGISGSYVSRALNDHPAISDKTKDLIKKKAHELNYKQNTHAANLRQGSSKTMGVIVPHINQSFFSDVIAGMEEACFKHNYNLIICQSHESFEKECKAIETLIHQNVDCILISVATETRTVEHLKEVIKNKIELIQFDRCLDNLDGFKVLNDNKKAAYKVVRNLVDQGYSNIAFLGGPTHVTTFKHRKQGYLKAIKEAGLIIPDNFIVDDCLPKEQAFSYALELLSLKKSPDAFFVVSDHQSLGVLQAANDLGILIPDKLGIFGFANEVFTEFLNPALSSVDQQSFELGKCAVNLYFDHRREGNSKSLLNRTKIMTCDIIVRKSSVKKNTQNAKNKRS